MILGLRNKKNKDYITGFFFNFNRSLSKNDLFSSHKRFNIFFSNKKNKSIDLAIYYE